MTREDERVAEETDEYAVYERKRPRPEASARRDTSPETGPAPEPEPPQDTEPDERPPARLMDAFFGERDQEPAEPPLFEPPTDPGLLVHAETPAPTAEPPAARPAAPPEPPTTDPLSTLHSPMPTRGGTMRIAIAATEFNYDITSMMLERAKAHAAFLGAHVTHVVRVPGVYDLPLAVRRLIKRDDVDAVVTIGCVIEGETDHDDLVIQHAARKIIDLSLESDKPVGLGITGPGMSRMQAMARVDRAKEAVEAVVRLHNDLASL